MKIEKLENIQSWQEARYLTKMIYTHTKKLLFKKDFELCRQIQTASISIMANIAEGFDRRF